MAAEKSLVPDDLESNIISMVDVLEEETELEEDARAVLGGSDSKNCTYTKEYVKRQALYACLTCIPPETGRVGGICLACSLACHEGHNLVELYTKRNFRCDCGNDRYSGKKCNLIPVKSPQNELNVYNHNFSGVYCSCSRPFPDPDVAEQDEMIQCVICEDWFHAKHLNCPVPSADDYGEMICHLCTVKYPFLGCYGSLVKSSIETPASEVPVNVTENQVNSVEMTETCIIKHSSPADVVGTLFLVDDWRKSLCMCNECRAMYTTNGLSFLFDPDDTVKSYEEMGKSLAGANSSQYEQGMHALSQLDRTKQIEAIHGYNYMKLQLMEFLKNFAENQQVVREEDIRMFFESLKNGPPTTGEPPNFCH